MAYKFSAAGLAADLYARDTEKQLGSLRIQGEHWMRENAERELEALADACLDAASVFSRQLDKRDQHTCARKLAYSGLPADAANSDVEAQPV